MGAGDGQRGLHAACSPWGRKESDMTEQLNWTELNSNKATLFLSAYFILVIHLHMQRLGDIVFLEIFYFVLRDSLLTSVTVLGEQQRNSVIHIYVSILPQTLLPSKLPHNIEKSSMYYTIGPCWLSILNIAQRISKHKFIRLGDIVLTVSQMNQGESHFGLTLK